MHVLGTGLAEFVNFKSVLEAKYPCQLPSMATRAEDGFNWQKDVVKAIKSYSKRERLSALYTFRYFDQNFDGQVSIGKMRYSLENYLSFNPAKFKEQRLDWLLRLLSFFKEDLLRQSCFKRLL